MHPSDKSMDIHSDHVPTSEESAKPVDFTVDSAGNVSPRTREQAARMGERTAPQRESRRRSD